MCGYCRQPLNNDLIKQLKGELPQGATSVGDAAYLGLSGWGSMAMTVATTGWQTGEASWSTLSDVSAFLTNNFNQADIFDFRSATDAQEANQIPLFPQQQPAPDEVAAAAPASQVADWMDATAAVWDDFF